MPMPSGKVKITPSVTSEATSASNPFEKLNIKSKTFVPAVLSATPVIQSSVAGETLNSTPETQGYRAHTDSVDIFEDFGGYKNPHKATIDIEKEKRKQQEIEEEEERSKTYSIEFLRSFKDRCRTRPNNMALLVLPHKKRQFKLN